MQRIILEKVYPHVTGEFLAKYFTGVLPTTIDEKFEHLQNLVRRKLYHFGLFRHRSRQGAPYSMDEKRMAICLFELKLEELKNSGEKAGVKLASELAYPKVEKDVTIETPDAIYQTTTTVEQQTGQAVNEL